MNTIRALVRILAFAFHVFYWVCRIIVSHLVFGQSADQDQRLRQQWARELMKITGFRITFAGSPVEETALYVSNHRSSLDPVIMLTDFKAHPISKAEVAGWPLVGKGAALTGVIFVRKTDRQSRGKTKEAILRELQAGNSILIYPEGRTHAETTTIRFNKGSFEMAAKGGFPVVPVAIEYEDAADNWDHSDNLLVHFIKRFGKRYTNIHVVYGHAVRSEDPWKLLESCQTWIDATICQLRKALDQGPALEKHP